MTEETYEAAAENQRELLMLKGLVLTRRQAEKWSDMLTELTADQILYTTAAYEADCANRAAMACDTFQYTNTGFTATISTEKDVPVFFSIPYESGWTAYVNGEKADIERVNVGFMAIRVNAGTNVEIEFVYETPGLLLGGLITLLCIALLVLYLLCMRAVEKYRRRMVILAHNMVVRPLSHYAKKHNTSFTNHTLIRLKPRLKADRALEKKEGFTNDD